MSNGRELFYLQDAQPLTISKVGVSYATRVIYLIAGFSIFRLILGSAIELGNDEAYYWLYTQQLQWNYFDHPPMVALFGKVFTLGLRFEQYEVMVRLGSFVSAACSTWFLYKATTIFHSSRAGWMAALLFNTSYYASLIAGLFIMPDSPQMFFWTLNLFLLARLVRVNDRSWRDWILFGVAAGFCIMSKVHGAFIWIGTGLFVILLKRNWLQQPHIYVAALLTLLVVSPLLLWNIQNQFVTFHFHSNRVVVQGFNLNEHHFRNELFGQIFVNNPVNVALIVLSLTTARKLLKPFIKNISILLFIGVPLILILLFVSLFRPVLPHWSGPAYVSLLPAAAIVLSEVKPGLAFPSWLKWSTAAFLIFAIMWPLVVKMYPGTWGSRAAIDYGRGDVTLDRYGWKEAGEAFMDFYEKETTEGKLPPNIPVVTHKWWGAHVEYYFARPAGLTMMGLGRMQDVGTYLWLNDERREKVDMSQAISIIPSDEHVNPEKFFMRYYQEIHLIHQIDVWRNGKKAKHYSVYLLKGWRGLFPEVE